MNSTTKLSVTDLNPHLLCVLCGGYLVDATTIVECIHSFCRTCITRYLESSKYCPICDVQVHKTRPLSNVRADKTLQTLVYKLIPGLFKDEMRRRREFYAANPDKDKPSPSSSVNASEERGDVKDEDELSTRGDEEKISLCLQHCQRLPPYRNGSLAVVKEDTRADRRYLLCPASVTIAHLKKLLRIKFDLPAHYRVDVFYSDESLRDVYTLLDVATIYSWRRIEPLKLYYIVYDQSVTQLHLTPPSVRARQHDTTAEPSQTPTSFQNYTLKLSPRKSSPDSMERIPEMFSTEYAESDPGSPQVPYQGAPRDLIPEAKSSNTMRTEPCQSEVVHSVDRPPASSSSSAPGELSFQLLSGPKELDLKEPGPEEASPRPETESSRPFQSGNVLVYALSDEDGTVSEGVDDSQFIPGGSEHTMADPYVPRTLENTGPDQHPSSVFVNSLGDTRDTMCLSSDRSDKSNTPDCLDEGAIQHESFSETRAFPTRDSDRASQIQRDIDSYLPDKATDQSSDTIKPVVDNPSCSVREGTSDESKHSVSPEQKRPGSLTEIVSNTGGPIARGPTPTIAMDTTNPDNAFKVAGSPSEGVGQMSNQSTTMSATKPKPYLPDNYFCAGSSKKLKLGVSPNLSAPNLNKVTSMSRTKNANVKRHLHKTNNNNRVKNPPQSTHKTSATKKRPVQTKTEPVSNQTTIDHGDPASKKCRLDNSPLLGENSPLTHGYQCDTVTVKLEALSAHKQHVIAIS